MRIRRTRLYGASCTRTAGGPTNASEMVPMYGLRRVARRRQPELFRAGILGL